MSNKVEYLRNLLANFRPDVNPNWEALTAAIGDRDQEMFDLLEDIKKELSFLSADGVYLDRIASNLKIIRDYRVGMSDISFRKYIYTMSFAPKQIKKTIDDILDIFYSKEHTTAYVATTVYETFALKDGWTLEYTVDKTNIETITFVTDNFVNINAATAMEVVNAINSQALYSFAAPDYNLQNNVNYVRVYTNTLGTSGSIEITGGLSNIALKFENFNANAGNGFATTWQISKIGQTVSFTRLAGMSYGPSYVSAGDFVLIDVPGYETSAEIVSVDLNTGTFSFISSTAPAGTVIWNQTSADQIKFMKPYIFTSFMRESRALCWDIQNNSFVVELPPTPSVLEYKEAGAGRTNNFIDKVTGYIDNTSLTIEHPIFWPSVGTFIMEPTYEILEMDQLGNIVTGVTYNSKTSFQDKIYSYTSIVGNTLIGITPNLPDLAQWYNPTIITGVRAPGGICTVVLPLNITLKVGNPIAITGTIGLLMPMNGAFDILSVVNGITTTTITFKSIGIAGAITAGIGTASWAVSGITTSGSKIYPYTSQINTDKKGTYMWDLDYPFTVHAEVADLDQPIYVGQNFRVLQVTGNTLPNSEGYLIINFGLSNEEGPIKYYRIDSNGLSIDSLYYFKNAHSAGSRFNLIDVAPKAISTTGGDYALYVVDPKAALTVLEDDILSLKTAGIFTRFNVLYPVQYYAFF